jgi:hypothetical protein
MRHRTVRVGEPDSDDHRRPDVKPYIGDPVSGGGWGAEPGGSCNSNRFESHQPINIILGTTRPTRLEGTAAAYESPPAKTQLEHLPYQESANAWHKKALLWFMSFPILVFGLLLLLEALEDVMQPSQGAFGWGGPPVDSSFTRLATRMVLLWTGVVGTREILT